MIFKSFGLNFNDLIKKKNFLLYGENLSLITEISEKIISESNLKFGLTSKRYQEDYLIQNSELIKQLLNSDNLFGEEEIIIIGKATDKIIDILDEKTIFYTIFHVYYNGCFWPSVLFYVCKSGS